MIIMEVLNEKFLSIQALRELYFRDERTPESVIEEIISRAQEDAEMNIWIVPPTLELVSPYLELLKELDPASTPLWGIPFAIKDNIDLAGVPTTAGCPGYAYTPSEHAVVVDRLIKAGAIPVGKTNLDQFATGLVGTRSPYGETQNSLKPELISGGSSSGSAVAVARGLVAFSLGTDTSGSGRVPAALNNLVGFKSSVGAWPIKGVVPACASLDCVTVFTHSFEEALEVDSVARGQAANDPWSKSIPKPSLQLPEKFCLPKQALDFFGPYEEEYRAAWEKMVSRLETLNIAIEYIDYDPFVKAAEILYGGPWVAERWSDLGAFIDANEGKALPVTEQILRSGSAKGRDAASVFHAMHELQNYKLYAKQQLENAVLILPTSGGTWTREQVQADPIATNNDMGHYTNHCNLLDLCAIAIPAGEASSQVPFGITLFALSDNESLTAGTADLLLSNGELLLEREEEIEVDTTLVAVCGLHMRGYPLEKQMLEFKAHFVRETYTAKKYQFIKLPTNPAKPGLVKKSEGGGSIKLEIWEMPKNLFGNFVTSIPAPLGIGKIELDNGTEVPGFICEQYVVEDGEDITKVGYWGDSSSA